MKRKNERGGSFQFQRSVIHGYSPVNEPNTNLLIDGGFEFGIADGSMNNTTFKPTKAWVSNSNTPFESWGNGFNGQNAKEGKNFIELDNGSALDSYSQSVQTIAGQRYSLSLESMLRAGVAPSTSGVELVWNGQVVSTFTPGSATRWQNFAVDVVGTGGRDTLTIREVAGQSNGVGALIDDVKLIATGPSSIPFDPSASNGSNPFVTKVADNALLSGLVDNDLVRDLNGTGNNRAHPDWGANDQPFVRITKPAYQDGVAAPRGVVNGVQTLPNERDISNAIVNQDKNNDGKSDNQPNEFNSDLFTMSFGQFFDHGLDFVQRSTTRETYTVALKPGDPLYKFSDDGNPSNDVTSITLTRGAAADGTGVNGVARQQINKTSPYIDQSQTYGSDESVAYYLRESLRDAQGNILRDANGVILKSANLANGALDPTGRANLPTYADILMNNGVPKAVIDQAIAANDMSILRNHPNFVDVNNVKNPWTGQPSNHPLLLDRAGTAMEQVPGFQVKSLLEHYIGGDGRVNENAALTPIHVVWHREHDYWVEKLRSENPSWNEEKLFESAKIIVEGEYQRVVFDEFSAIMSNEIPPQGRHGFSGYNPNVNAGISTEFAGAVYRVGHSQINETIPVVQADGSIREVPLVDAFLNPALFRTVGSDALIKGSSQVLHQRIDEQIVNAVRNQLLGQPTDLGALNIARGRELGVPSLNELRKQLYENGSALGINSSDFGISAKGNENLKPYTGWADFAANLRDPSLVEDFKKVYGYNDADVNKVDLWVGGLAEKPQIGQMGRTFGFVFREQLDRLQDGDAYYYKLRLDGTNLLEQIEEQSFSDIIMRNTGLKHLQDQIFEKTTDIIMSATEVSKANIAAQSATIVGNALNNKITAGEKGDTLYGEDGNDTLIGGAGADGLRGGKGNDSLIGGGASDRLLGEDGDDFLDAGIDNDALFGGNGNDSLLGGDGNDELTGGEGNDTLRGGNGNDTLRGSAGDDIMYGDAGDDVFFTGGGNDTIYTGSGYNVVVMGAETGVTRIKDFVVNVDAVDMRLFGIHNMKELAAKATIWDDGTSTHIKVGSSELILEGIRQSNLTGNSFQFVLDIENRLGNGLFNARPQKFDIDENLVDTLQNGGWEYMDEKWAMGWQNLNGSNIEVQRVGVNRFIEIDVDRGVDAIYQDVKTEAGQKYALSFDTALRSGVSASTSTVEVLWNNTVIAKFDPSSTAWTTREFEVTGTGGNDRLTFREEAGDDNNVGALLDNVNLIAKAAVTPPPPPPPPPVDPEVIYQNVAATQWVTGTTSNDVFVVNGRSADFNVNKTQDGLGVVIWNGSQFDILKGIDKLRFTDKDVKADANGQFDIHGTVANNGEKLYQNVSGIQFLQGTTTKDVFVVGADKTGYGYSKTQDGTGIVVWKGSDFDVLHGFETIRFNDQDIAVSSIV